MCVPVTLRHVPPDFLHFFEEREIFCAPRWCNVTAHGIPWEEHIKIWFIYISIGTLVMGGLLVCKLYKDKYSRSWEKYPRRL